VCSAFITFHKDNHAYIMLFQKCETFMKFFFILASKD